MTGISAPSKPQTGSGIVAPLRFGVFEFDPSAGELKKNGVRVKLQEQPAKVLSCLLEHAGHVVPRHQLHRLLWPEGTFVEYEQSLNKAVNKLRAALSDSPEEPRFIETVPRRGYRFTGRTERLQAPVKPAPSHMHAMLWLAALSIVVGVVQLSRSMNFD